MSEAIVSTQQAPQAASQEASYWMDGRHVERAEFYAVACDPRRSVVVEACAGAGKTWMLVSRILRALLDGAEPQGGFGLLLLSDVDAHANEDEALFVIRDREYRGEHRDTVAIFMAQPVFKRPIRLAAGRDFAELRDECFALHGVIEFQRRLANAMTDGFRDGYSK